MGNQKIILQQYNDCHISFTIDNTQFKDDFRKKPKIIKTIYPNGRYTFSIDAKERYSGVDHRYVLTIFYDLTSYFGTYQDIMMGTTGSLSFIKVEEKENVLNITAKWIEDTEYIVIIKGIKGDDLNVPQNMVDSFNKKKNLTVTL